MAEQVSKPKNQAAAALVGLRWAKTSAKKRSELGRKMVQARWAKARKKGKAKEAGRG